MNFDDRKLIELKFHSMLKLQDEINSQINADWRKANNPWYRAIWTECAEMMEHVGWKWWKKIQSDKEQVQLEIVDIFHFGMSDLLQKHDTISNVIESSLSELSKMDDKLPTKYSNILDCIEEFTHQTLKLKEFNIPLFVQLAKFAELNTSELHRRYVAKNILNSFRQKHGYKEGTYIKIWEGREDNEWLMETMNKLNTSPEKLAMALYSELESRYQMITKS